MAPSLKALAQKAKSQKAPAEPKKVAKPTSTLANIKSTEYIHSSDESDEDSSEDESDNKEEAPPAKLISKPNGIPASAESSSSEEESGSDESSSSEEESDEEEENEEEEPAPKKVAIAPKSSKNPPAKDSEPKDAAPVVASRYKLPAGFDIASLEGSAKMAEMFKKSNLEGKQIWYITAPASVPISSIKDMSWEDAMKGKSVLSHKDNEYAFSHDTTEDSTHTKVMIPNSTKEGFRTVTRPVEKILHLKQIVKLAGIQSTDSTVAISSKATVPAKKPVRQQPKGLRMRFRPLGFGDGQTGKIGSSSSGESDEEMNDAPRVFRRPSSIAESSDVEMTEAPSQPILPPKKHKSSKKEAAASQETNGHLKRKHASGEERHHKSSSSKLTSTTDDQKLNSSKKKQTDLHKSKAGQSVSIEGLHASKDTPSRASKTTSAASAILPPPKTNQLLAANLDEAMISSQKSSSKKRKRSETKKGHSQDATQYTQVDSATEERPEKKKKLKHKEQKHSLQRSN